MRILLFAFVAGFLVPRIALVAAVSMSTLQGLPAVFVNVRTTMDEAKGFELTEGDLAARALEVLSGAHLAVAGAATGGVPELRITVRLAHIRGPSHLYVTELELVEPVAPERSLATLETIPAVTWQRLSMGIANSPRTVLDAVASLVAAFAAEQRTENP